MHMIKKNLNFKTVVDGGIKHILHYASWNSKVSLLLEGKAIYMTEQCAYSKQ